MTTLPEKPTFVQSAARAVLRAISWRIDLNLPAESKYVVIGAPHTSNWDLIYALLLIYATGLKVNWIGKDSAFWWPLGPILRRLGGIPVNRRLRNDFVGQVVQVFERSDELIIVITPEGTRSKSPYWRSGFYYMALGANVPIVLGYIDYVDRVMGFGPSFYPTGDIQADFVQIQEFYGDKRGKFTRSQGKIQLKPASETKSSR